MGVEGRGRFRCMSKGPTKTSLGDSTHHQVTEEALFQLQEQLRQELQERDRREQLLQEQVTALSGQISVHSHMISQLQGMLEALMLRLGTSLQPPDVYHDASPGVSSTNIPANGPNADNVTQSPK